MTLKNPNLELKRARKRGRAIVEEAKIKALSIIAEAYGEEIQKIASQIAVEFKNEALFEMARFKKELEEKVVTVEGAAERVLAAEYDEIKLEIDKYKASKIAQIDSTAREVLIDATKKILGKSIDMRAHEELVTQALEDAKRQNLF
jgi:F0F1-type ATP synthase membrane subunit b/b'